MTSGDNDPGRQDRWPFIDTAGPHPSRMYNYLLGGPAHFEVDRNAVAHGAAAVGGIDNARADVQANRAFLARAVRHLAGDAGFRQFLDIGCGIPARDDTRVVAQRIVPEARVVFVDNDPIVLAYSHQLLECSPQGAAAFVEADLRDPDNILKHAAETLDPSEPVAVVLVAILHFFPDCDDSDDPYALVARLLDPLPSGSYLALSHLTADFEPEAVPELVARLNQVASDPFVLRTKPQLEQFFDGLDIVEPGLVQVDQWHPDPGTPPAPPAGRAWVPSFYGAVGRKP
jgi:hypothetical protein